jgi:hypothetical protein
MKVKATFQHVFEVTREVEVDEEDFARLVEHEERRQRTRSDSDMLMLWINSLPTGRFGIEHTWSMK